MGSGRSFDGLAANYDRREALAGDPLEPWLRDALPAAGHTAVDLACGAGRHSVLLAERFDRVLAVDLSAEMIDLARQRRPAPNIDYRQGDLLDIDGRFDLVFCSSALHDVDDLDRALAHARSLVAPGGTALLADVVARRTPQRPWWLRTVALSSLPVDLLRRPRAALELYRLTRDPGWIAHLATDRYLTRAQFERRYRAHFPNAAFWRAGHLHACHWENR
jgi:ubiquinone/menaquinone biosynthesis C-methylase UbiE